ncbi:MAG: PAS domain-containing protein, partial [Phycisphaeraceae bacterium]
MLRAVVAFVLLALIVILLDDSYLLARGHPVMPEWVHTGIELVLVLVVIGFLAIPRLHHNFVHDQRLRRQAERLGHAAQAAHLGLWTWDVKRDRCEFDAGSAELLGIHSGLEYCRDDLLGCLLPQDREALSEALTRCVDEGVTVTLEYRMTDASGEARWVYGTMTPEKGLSGRVVRVTGVNWDVTARRVAEKESEQNRLIFQQIGRVARIGGWRLNLDPPEPIWSEAVRHIHEAPEDYVPSLETAIKFYAPEGRPRIEAAVRAAIKTGESWDLELPLVTYRGRRIWVRALGVPQFENGVCTHILGSFQDITEQYETMTRIRESEQRLDLALSAAKQGLWDWQIQTGTTYFSDTWYTMLGYEPGELPMTLSTWEVLTHPDDLERAYARVNEHLRGERDQYRCEMRVRMKDGTWRWILDVGEVVERDSEGNPARMTGVHIDIDEQKRAQARVESIEQRLRCFVENTPAAVAMFDREMRYLVASEGWYQQYGIEQEDVSGLSHYEVFPDVPDRWREDHRRCLVGETLHCDRDCFERDDGSTVWIRWVLQPWRETDGSIGGIMMVTEVINAQIAYEHELSAALDAAELASRAKSEFLANMSHELRTPLNSVIGLSEVMLEGIFGPLSDKYREYISDINVSGQHLLEVITDILDISKIEAGEVDLEESIVDIPDIVRSSLRLAYTRTQDKRKWTSVDIPDGFPKLKADNRLVRQVLVNLLTNAIKFTHDDGDVGIVTAIDAEGGIAIQVVDTGIGIAPDDIPRALEPFGQVRRRA